MRALPLLAAAAALAGCSYDFRNAAEGLAAGEARGRALAPSGGSLAPAAAVSVTLRGSALTQASRASGLFTLQPLPPGRHVLLLRRGDAVAAERTVEVGFGGDGQLEGIALGDVRLGRTVTLRGRVTRPFGAPGWIEGGIAVDEATGATTVLDGDTFAFRGLSAGVHLLKVAARDSDGGTWVGGPIVLALGPEEEGKEVALAPLALHGAAGQGRIQLRLAGMGASVATDGVTISGLPVPATPDSSGLVDVTVPEGAYTLRVSGPGGLAGPAEPFHGVALAGLVADAGTAYFVAPDAETRSARGCTSGADCACIDAACTVGGTCTGGVCAGWTPPPVLPASVPFCPPGSVDFCTPADGFTCAATSYCAAPGPGLNGSCLPCGEACTYDGETVTAPVSGECGIP